MEASYWEEFSKPLYPSPTSLGGLDFGFDLTRGRMRLYGEVQTGLLAGLSAGPFLDLPLTLESMARGPVQVGLQSTLWLYYLVGLDYRFRISPSSFTHSAGFFTKAPLWMEADIIPEPKPSPDDF